MTKPEQWTSLYVRKTLDDTGLYPVNGTVASCPDIIPAGISPLAAPNTLITDDAWAKDYGGAVTTQQPGYIYVRGMNLGDKTLNGHLYLYWCPLSLVAWPTGPFDREQADGQAGGWSGRALRTNRGSTSVKVSAGPGARFVTEEPFLWIPEKAGGGPYSLIARVVADGQDNPIPELGTINSFAVYIAARPDMGWLNVTAADSAHPAFSRMQPWQQGSQESTVRFTLRCENVPGTFKVAFSSATPGPVPALVLPQTTVEGEDGIFVKHIDAKVPANWASNIITTCWANGVPAQNMKITLSGAGTEPAFAPHPRTAKTEEYVKK
jgi:hypothetical protein